MNKEFKDAWIYRLKTLPNREPGFASGLCSMVCLWLVLIPALIMAIKGAEFDLRHLIIPSVCAIGLATVLFVGWKRVALQLKEQENSVKNYSSEVIERSLGKLSQISSYFQWVSTMIFVLVAGSKGIIVKYIDIHDYFLAVQCYCVFALLFSFVLNRLYAYAKKRLEEVRQLTEEEKTLFKHEYLGRFLWPQIFWSIFLAIFYWLSS